MKVTGFMKSASKANPMPNNKVQPSPRSAVSSRKEELLEAEVAKLKEQLKQANIEKSELNSEYEKLSTICRSQRQQLHGIKQALASSTPPDKSTYKSQSSPEIQQQRSSNRSSLNPDQSSWQAFPEDPKTPNLVTNDYLKPVKTRNSQHNKAAATVTDARSSVTAPVINLNQSQCTGGIRKSERHLTSQPPGWAAF
ncbi:hypothetical protein CTI12_AA541850 [Artemisia annua]|uniref:non-specific serine/threonine protein kinase n=1 Tax=Artemisia annua TaxID=35608 RepID=A0A2U1KSW9_ARTAN|nr:hypothetical protein CTI12_AA541850 [Artemisia annua]